MSIQTVRTRDAQALIRLFGDARATANPVEAGRLLVDGLCKLVDADAGWFVDLVRAEGVWAPVGAGTGSIIDDRVLRYSSEFGREFPVDFDVMGVQIIGDPRPSFVQSWSDAMAATSKPRLAPFADLVQTLGIADMVDPVFALSPDHRFAFNLQRVGSGRRRFTEREVKLLDLAAAELHWLHKTGRMSLSALTRSMPPARLPLRLRQILDQLLLGRSPKQIARYLGLSIHTVREHIQRLYRHFGVSSRDELMAKFVSP